MTEILQLLVSGHQTAGKIAFMQTVGELEVVNIERIMPTTQVPISFYFNRLNLNDEQYLFLFGKVATRGFDIAWEKELFASLYHFLGYIIVWSNQQIDLNNNLYKHEYPIAITQHRALAKLTSYPYLLVINEFSDGETITRTPDEWREYFEFSPETKVLMGSVLDKSFALTVVIELLKLNPPSELIQNAIEKLTTLAND